MPKTSAAKIRRQTRSALDPRLSQAREASFAFETPRSGWIRGIRTALGMSAADLANRIGVDTSTVLRMERGESRGTIQLSTLKRAAEALNCDLVYALVPRESLAKSVRVQAEKRAAKMMAPIEHTMKLEDQSVPEYLTEESREELIAAWQRKIGLWSE